MMNRLQVLLVALFLSFSTAMPPARAADNLNDGNTHDTRDGPENADDEDTDGDPDDNCHSSSPVLIQSGEFIWADTDVVLNGRPSIALSRYYRSFDSREGIFGKGWNTRCEKALIRVLDYVPSDPDEPASATVPRLGYIYRLANGRRYTFTESAPDVFDAPAALPGMRLSIDENGAPTLRDIDGSRERYDATGRLAAEIDRNGNAVDYIYEGGALARIADANGRFLTLGYDSTGHVASVTDHTDRVWRYTYNADGSLASVTDPADGVRRYEYETITRRASSQTYPAITRVVDESGTSVIAVTYAATGKVESYTVGENTYTYSEGRGFVYKTDSMGARWAYMTDEKGHKNEVFPPINAGEPERYEYDEHGNVTSYTDLAGTEFKQGFDALGRLVSTTTPDGTATIEYVEGTSWPATMTSVTGRTVSFAYDDRGNPVQVTDPLGNATTFEWNANGDLVSSADALGNRSTRSTNALGQVTSVVDALGRASSLTYDHRANVATITDSLGGVTTYRYDVLDRMTGATDAVGNVTAQAYDPAARTLSITDASGGVTTFGHDEHGRLVSETRPDGSELAHAYRTDNLLSTTTDPRGTVSRYTYDRGRRMTGVAAGSTRYSYTFDVLGRVTEATSRDGRVELAYDRMHRPLAETQNGDTQTYTYDAEGELISTTAFGEELRYARDDRGLLISFTTPEGTHRYEHDAAGRLVAHTLPDGARATVRHDAAGQILEQDYTAVSGDIYTYAYDPLGRIEQVTGGTTGNRSYSYDGIGRLTGAGMDRDYTYQYDALGNRLEGGGVYDAFNKLLENATYSYAYDEAGGLISRVDKSSGEETRYAYDGLRRMTSVETAPTAGERATSSVTFGYDAFGRRVSKSVDRAAVEFRWRGQDLVAELVDGARVAAYRYDGDYTAAEYVEGSDVYFVQTDRLDTPRTLTDTTGRRYEIELTDPFGAASPMRFEQAGPTFNQRFPGQYLDRETGLDYNRFRYYDSTNGRYTRDDPIGLQGGPNAYLYAAASPTMAIDPQGLAVETVLDVVSVFLSARALADCPSWANAAWLTADIVGAVVPFLPAAGTVRHGADLVRALPPPRPTWTGRIINYKKGAMSPIEHIFYRHGPTSGFSNVGRFAEGTRARDVASMVSEAAAGGRRTWQTNGGSSIVHDFGRTIGTHSDGTAATRLQVYVNELGEVMTAFPIR